MCRGDRLTARPTRLLTDSASPTVWGQPARFRPAKTMSTSSMAAGRFGIDRSGGWSRRVLGMGAPSLFRPPVPAFEVDVVERTQPARQVCVRPVQGR